MIDSSLFHSLSVPFPPGTASDKSNGAAFGLYSSSGEGWQGVTGSDALTPLLCVVCLGLSELQCGCQSGPWPHICSDSRQTAYETLSYQSDSTVCAIADQATYEYGADEPWSGEWLQQDSHPLQNLFPVVEIREDCDECTNVHTLNPVMTSNPTLDHISSPENALPLPIPVASPSRNVDCPYCDYRCAFDGPSFRLVEDPMRMVISGRR